MSKQLLMGVALGVGFATAGGVTAYQFFGKADGASGSAVVLKDGAHGVHEGNEAHGSHEAHAADETHDSAHDAHSTHAASPAQVQAAPAQVQPQAAAVPAAAGEECYEEVVAAEPRDRNRIAGTAIGALVGGAVAKDVGDRDLTTAVGAAVGAFAGNRIQQKIQERNATSTTEVRCAPAQ